MRYVIALDAALRIFRERAMPPENTKLVAPTLLRSQAVAHLYAAARLGEIDRAEARAQLDHMRSLNIRLLGEGCACCRVWLTPEERLLTEMLDHLRHGRTGRERTVAQLLCDGTPADDVIAMAEIYLRRHAPDPAAAPA